MALRDVDASRHARPTLTEEQLRPTERWRKIRALAEAFAHERAAGEAIAAGLAYPLDAYDQFRRDVAIRPPPLLTHPSKPIRVLVDARQAAPFLLRATLRSLQDQSISEWTASVLASEELRIAPVASFAQTDERVAFAPRDSEQAVGEGIAILLDAGTVLDRETIAWLSFALLRSGAAAAYADHDHGVADPAFRMLRADPVLYGTFDEALFAGGPAPAVIAVSDTNEAISGKGVRDRRAMLIEAGQRGRVAHVPRLLATQLSLPLVARTGRAEPDDAKPGRLAPLVRPASLSIAPVPRDDQIAVIIPTRDGAGLLSRAIASLRATARRPERLDIVVVDNRSIAADTAILFRRLEEERTARIVPFDAPFNWSLASNLGAASSDAPLIVFANNDVEMLSPGWDDVVADTLSAAQVGAVGARLLYPDRTIQHAGIAFGFGPGGTEHEGRGIPAVNHGPGQRYAIRHAVSAVTGAFLAVRRADFHRVSGFDAGRLMIAHSDVDFCLRLRELGRTILYCPEIEAIHHEGATRGRNQTKAAIAWDEGERMDLLARWGETLVEDPGISPYWQRGEKPFDLLREPTTRGILAQIDRSASDYPWMPSRSDPS